MKPKTREIHIPNGNKKWPWIAVPIIVADAWDRMLTKIRVLSAENRELKARIERLEDESS